MLDQRPSVPPTVPPPACPAYVDVVLPRRLHRHFTYLIPAELKDKVVVGQSVIVPFGAQDLHGLVIAVHPRLPPGAPDRGMKAIRSLADASPDEHLTASQIELSRWVADRYAAPWGQCIKLVSPPIGQAGRSQVRYLLTEQGLASLSSPEEMGELDMELLLRLSRRPKGITAATLTQGAKTSVMRTLQALIRRGLVLRRDEAMNPRPLRSKKDPAGVASQTFPEKLAFEGTAHPPLEAASWPATVSELLSRDVFVSLLVQAGCDTRLWCLVQAAQDTLRRGRRVLIITGDVEHANRLTEALAAT
ncbi:MAG: primosomal protein N' family DNA-binding protein, partial [Nitrospira sp.]